MEVRCNNQKYDFGFEMRRLLLRRIKDYYQSCSKRLVPDNEVNIDLLNMLCNDKEAGLDYGYIPIFDEDELSQVFYNYQTGESVITIKTDEGYEYLDDSYCPMSSFSSNIALNIGLCYKIFVREQSKIEDEDLANELSRETIKIENLLHKQLVKKYSE